MSDAYLDANVILRHLTGDPPEMAEAALATFAAAEDGTVRLRLLEVTLAEVVWVLESYYGQPRDEIASTVAQLLQADGLDVERPDRLMEAIGLYREHDVDFADALVAAAARAEDVSEVCSFDADFERIPGVTRRPPGDSPPPSGS